MAMAPILDEGVSSLSFRLEGVEQVVPYECIKEFLGFQKGALEQVYVHEGTLEGFWNLISGEAHQQRNSIRNPIIQVFHSWMCRRIMGRMRETKITNTELNWLYSALIARQPIDPTHLMINQWCCEATSVYWFGVLLLHVGYLFETGYYKEPEASPSRTSLGFDYMKQGNYISVDERGGFKVAKVNLPLPVGRLRLFLRGKKIG
jgi:hypothetical protein